MASSKSYDLAVDGLNDVLRALRQLPKEASAELRQASQVIADRHMAPAWRNAALNYAGPWGQVIAASVKVKRDRVPAVSIGGNRKAFSGGATPTMVRFPSDKGRRGRSGPPKRDADGRIVGGVPEAFGAGSDWISKVRSYQPQAIKEWAQAVDRVVGKWEAM